MGIIDFYFTNNSIDIDSIIEDIMIVISPAYMKTPVLRDRSYYVPALGVDEIVDYYRIPLQDNIVTNLLNAVTLKSEYADVKVITDLVETDEFETPDEYLYGYALHGRNIVINNGLDAIILGVQSSEVAKDIGNVEEELVRYLKQAYYYLMVSDFSSLYRVVELLSNAKSNILAKNIHTEKNRRNNKVFPIKLLQVYI